MSLHYIYTTFTCAFDVIVIYTLLHAFTQKEITILCKCKCVYTPFTWARKCCGVPPSIYTSFTRIYTPFTHFRGSSKSMGIPVTALQQTLLMLFPVIIIKYNDIF